MMAGSDSDSDCLELKEEDSYDKMFQGSLFCNKYLPYHSVLEEEAASLLADIKLNLSVAIQKHELWPGALYWTNRLAEYINMYGLHFSKKDHIKFIRLLYELVITPKLESPLLQFWSGLLRKMLMKPKSLTRSDLVLPWRPLYEVSTEVFKSKFADLGMKIYSANALSIFNHLIDCARRYFSVESTQEMLDEWRPMLCPFDTALSDGMANLSYFLPTLLPPEHHHLGFKLWFDELLDLWLGLHYETSATECFIKLFIRLAKENRGYIDWDPYLPQIFSRILRSFQLPVGSSEMRVNQAKSQLESSHSANFIVSLLGNGSRVQEHLNNLMLSLESFYHPSNYGRQTRKLLSFLKEMSLKFILRVKSERFSSPRWYNTIPKHAKLTEEDIDAFVQCLIPAMKMAIFSKGGTMEAALTLHNLALVRPEMILPDLLNSTYTALETVTEPHQVTATLQCLSVVSRELLSGGHGRYPEGRKHLFSLLTHALPGIDSNDYRKTLVSGMLISALSTMVPLVDCSASITSSNFNMTEDEKELCSLTASFEDFILLYLDRCFALVESTRLEQATALDRAVSTMGKDHESIMGAGISGSVHSILVQSSSQLFDVALDKVFRFATSHVFESEIAGRLCADMCASASKASPAKSLKRFIPHCLKEIDKFLEDPYQIKAEYPDHGLIWNLQLLSQQIQYMGIAVLPYADDLLTCLKRCVHMTSKTGSKYAAEALYNILKSLTTLYPLEARSIAGGFDMPPETHLYIRDWSIPVDQEKPDIEWHVPSLDELMMVDRILEEFLWPEMEILRGFMAGEDLERETLNQTLQLVQEIMKGAAMYLPMLTGPQVEGCPTSVVSLVRSDFLTFKLAKTPSEKFSRDKLAILVHDLIDHIMKTRENDTKSMFLLVMLTKLVLSYQGVSQIDLDHRWLAFKYSNRVISDQLRGRKSQIRPLLISRVHLQHESRLMERSMSVQTKIHHMLLKDLLKMAVSEYAQVRIRAQVALAGLMDVYLYSGRMLLPHVLPFFKKDENISHEQFKGALHVLLISSIMTVYTHDWKALKDTLPAIVQADHSEKPSIQKLMTKLTTGILQKYEHFGLQRHVSDESIVRALDLYEVIPASDRDEGIALCEQLGTAAINNYESAVSILVKLSEEGKLQWRYSQMAIGFLVMLIRHDHPLPIEAVRMHVGNLVHDALSVRKMALNAMGLILQQQKRKRKKVPVDLTLEAGISHTTGHLSLGEKEENLWLCYDPDRCPTTQEQWDQFKFIDKTHWGYNTYPKVLLTYASYTDQPSLTRTPEEMSEAERVIFEMFSSEEFVEKLVTFLSMEEVKGKDHFDVHKYILFKCLFRNFGPTFLPLFRPHIEKLALDSQSENNQRFASEIIAAIVSSSKHWNYEMVEAMKSFLEPLLADVMDAVTAETISDWSLCMTEISANRDPRRLHWLFQLLMKNPINGENGSFKDASRLFLLQCILAQQEWRVPPLLNRLVPYLQSHLAHSYKNVRERVGSVLSQIYSFDLPNVVTMKFNPRKKDIIEYMLQKMPTLEQLPSLTEDKATLR